MPARLVNRPISVQDARLLATLTELRRAIAADESTPQARKQRPRRLINHSYTTADRVMLCERSAAIEAAKAERRSRNITTILYWWRKFYQFEIHQAKLGLRRKLARMRSVNDCHERKNQNGWKRLSYRIGRREICRFKWIARQELINKQLAYAKHGTPLTSTLSCQLCRLDGKGRNIQTWRTCLPTWRFSMRTHIMQRHGDPEANERRCFICGKINAGERGCLMHQLIKHAKMSEHTVVELGRVMREEGI